MTLEYVLSCEFWEKINFYIPSSSMFRDFLDLSVESVCESVAC